MNTDPITLAREVAEEYAAGGSPSLSVGEVETTLDTLARAVLRVADAIDSLERDTANWETAARNASGGSLGRDKSAILVARETENRIRAALNGGDRG